MANIIEAFLVYSVLIKSTIDDTKTLTISRELLYGGWTVLAIWQLIQGNTFHVFLLLGVLLWGLGYFPGWLGVVFIPAIPYWPALLLGAGVREGLVGDGDLAALTFVFLYSPVIGWLGFIGILLWLGYHRKTKKPWVPALPGLLLGTAVAFLWIVRQWG